MPKTLSDIKEASNQLQRRAKLGQLDEKTLFGLFNDLVNNLAAKESASMAVQTPPVLETTSLISEVAAAVKNPSVADVVAPKRRRRKGVTVGNQAPAVPAVTVGNPVAETTQVEPSLGAAQPAPEQSANESGGTKVIPHNVKAGRGVTVGTQSTINTGVTVGSAPVNPAGFVTVGGRPRKV